MLILLSHCRDEWCISGVQINFLLFPVKYRIYLRYEIFTQIVALVQQFWQITARRVKSFTPNRSSVLGFSFLAETRKECSAKCARHYRPSCVHLLLEIWTLRTPLVSKALENHERLGRCSEMIFKIITESSEKLISTNISLRHATNFGEHSSRARACACSVRLRGKRYNICISRLL